MVLWKDDTIVSPRESEWFGQYDSNHMLVELREQDAYTNDVLGLRTLDESGRLHFYEVPGDHMHLESWMITDLLIPFLIDAD
mmetsp:Transcript_17588/g.24241  ORF Transcript_17588/g.24241 Transcript_17588/m.24241 type:complete len:82 (+) Transcript_17588:668-913(+)